MADEPVLEDRYVLYLDFLGSSAVTVNWHRERRLEFIGVLHDIAQYLTSTEKHEIHLYDDGGQAVSELPEVSTFSDHVVFSMPGQIGALEGGPDKTRAEFVCRYCSDIISWVAESGLTIGLLIRGALTYGELYHKGGVVFGKGLVDAYRLESQVAIRPRVIISERVVDKLASASPDYLESLLTDEKDGLRHFNYFSGMIQYGRTGTPDEPARLAGWKHSHLHRITDEIRVIGRETREARHQVAKWEWFRAQFMHATRLISP